MSSCTPTTRTLRQASRRSWAHKAERTAKPSRWTAEAKAEAKVGRRPQSGRRLGDAQDIRGATTSCAQAEADATFAALKQHLETPKATGYGVEDRAHGAPVSGPRY